MFSAIARKSRRSSDRNSVSPKSCALLVLWPDVAALRHAVNDLPDGAAAVDELDEGQLGRVEPARRSRPIRPYFAYSETPSTPSGDRLPVAGFFFGVVDHSLAQADQWVFVPAGHAVGQAAQLDGESVEVLA
ncbi:hypothetical protein A5739_00120 [Mycobacterium colombiense]|uniref:hypothetical protein n=1 Tax=Mycobacterium colombiense TaxID=339268 RepID=UPI00096FD7E4|nr:hypothetical protein [Mycobacterium colombiense]OMB98664.1 hypothetical protein A5732_05125 [Mycobacterium colombiense]OMC16110.1 hypothetical protein A5737_00245 [Mycobacterium colombiense]OMC35260.1 hypothetical protein A5739_00120 [Mycobacterium colombiense]